LGGVFLFDCVKYIDENEIGLKLLRASNCLLVCYSSIN
jgi:hypothetical protein